jgi:carboxylate-amine ligase
VLDEQGELELVRAGVHRIFEQGTGAAEQRRARETHLKAGAPDDDGGGLGAVVAHAVRATLWGRAGCVAGAAAPAAELLPVRQY